MSETTKQPKLKLHYFNFPGRGEAIRLYCAYAGLELEDRRFNSWDDLTAMKNAGELPFGQVPLLEVDGTHKLVQSTAILRYLSQIAGLFPKDPLEAANVDAWMTQDTDAFTGATVATYYERFGVQLTKETQAKTFEVFCNTVAPRHLGLIETAFKESPTGWIAGTTEPSAADFVWFCRLAFWVPEKPEFSDKLKSLDDFPECKKFVERFRALPAIQAYYSK
eukprot:Nitzschia sp. Nitz4//scaffold98_size77359//22004//22666//NITZ4_005543-RA/size77359-processed-gene-0.36-mRNA-1//-1//CDS//3329560742//9013//frame0